jgi:hypothetical protein
MRPFGLGDRTFDSDVIYLAIIVSTLPFGFRVCVRTSGDCEYGAMNGEVIGLLWRFLNLLRRWSRVGFGSVLTWLALVLFCVWYVICSTAGDRLFVELAKVEDGWWWHSGMIGNMLEVGFGYFGMLGLDNTEGRMENIVGGTKPIAWCD